MSISDFRKKKLLFLFNVFFGEYLSFTGYTGQWKMMDGPAKEKLLKTNAARAVDFMVCI